MMLWADGNMHVNNVYTLDLGQLVSTTTTTHTALTHMTITRVYSIDSHVGQVVTICRRYWTSSSSVAMGGSGL